MACLGHSCRRRSMGRHRCADGVPDRAVCARRRGVVRAPASVGKRAARCDVWNIAAPRRCSVSIGAATRYVEPRVSCDGSGDSGIARADSARCTGLIVLMVCWVNIHGYFVNGILAIAAAVVAAGCGDPRGPLAAMDRRAAWMRGGALLAGCMAACALHPQGFGALAWPVRQLLLLRTEPALRTALTEFTPSLELLGGGGLWRLAALIAAPCVGLILAVAQAGKNPWTRVCVGTAIAVMLLAAPPLAAAPWPYQSPWPFGQRPPWRRRERRASADCSPSSYSSGSACSRFR